MCIYIYIERERESESRCRTQQLYYCSIAEQCFSEFLSSCDLMMSIGVGAINHNNNNTVVN